LFLGSTHQLGATACIDNHNCACAYQSSQHLHIGSFNSLMVGSPTYKHQAIVVTLHVFTDVQQMIERQNRELKQKDSIIALLTDQLDRVSGMAAAVADEVQATRRTLAFAASTAPHSAGSPLYRGSRQCSQSASPAATKGRPGRLAAGVSYKVEGSPRGVIISPEVTCQQQHQQEECFRGLQVKVASGLDVSGMQNWLHAQNGTLTQQVAGGRNSQAAAAVAAAAEALSAAEAAADDVREAPVTGAKRLRICSTESAEDVAAGGVVLKRAVSGGSSSSRQLVSTDHQAVPEEEEEEVGCGAATEVVTWQHQASPDSIMQEQQQQQLQHFENGVDPMMEDEEQYDMGGEEQSPDEREAASHLLAFSAAAKASSPQGPCSPTVFGSSRCGAGLREGHHPAPSGPVAEQHWHLPGGSHSHGGTQPGLPMAPALHTILLQQAPALVEAMAAKQTGMQAMAGSVPGAHLQQEASGRILLHHGQQGLPGRAAAPGNLHSYREHYHHLQLYHQQQQLTGSDGMAERRRKSETQDATWGPSRSTAAPANKARKGSWVSLGASLAPAAAVGPDPWLASCCAARGSCRSWVMWWWLGCCPCGL
jgi:hypothetical protein